MRHMINYTVVELTGSNNQYGEINHEQFGSLFVFKRIKFTFNCYIISINIYTLFNFKSNFQTL